MAILNASEIFQCPFAHANQQLIVPWKLCSLMESHRASVSQSRQMVCLFVLPPAFDLVCRLVLLHLLTLNEKFGWRAGDTMTVSLNLPSCLQAILVKAKQSKSSLMNREESALRRNRSREVALTRKTCTNVDIVLHMIKKIKDSTWYRRFVFGSKHSYSFRGSAIDVLCCDSHKHCRPWE